MHLRRSVRARVRSLHRAKLQAASVSIPRASARLGLEQTDGQTDWRIAVSFMPPPLRRGHINNQLIGSSSSVSTEQGDAVKSARFVQKVCFAPSAAKRYTLAVSATNSGSVDAAVT